MTDNSIDSIYLRRIVKNVGLMASTVHKNVYWCGDCATARAVPGEAPKCNTCTRTMENIGWFESTEDKVIQEIDDN